MFWTINQEDNGTRYTMSRLAVWYLNTAFSLLILFVLWLTLSPNAAAVFYGDEIRGLITGIAIYVIILGPGAYSGYKMVSKRIEAEKLGKKVIYVNKGLLPFISSYTIWIEN